MQDDRRNFDIDAALQLIADHRRRNVLQYLAGSDTGEATVSELARVLAETDSQQDTSVSDVTVELHHIHLPKLAEAGVVDYDADTRTVRYQPLAKLEELVDAVTDVTEGSSK